MSIGILGGIREDLEEGKAKWVRKPFLEESIRRHDQEYIGKWKLDKGYTGWNITTVWDVPASVTILCIDGFIVSPLLSLAASVEGVIRGIIGYLAFGLSYLPCKENKNLNLYVIGEALIYSSNDSINLAVETAWSGLKMSGQAIWAAMRFLWDTSCCNVLADK